MVDEAASLRRERLIADLDRVARGDERALRDVYDATSAKLFGVCLRISGDRDAAEDILQQVYLKVWDRAGRFDAERASPITWLCTIARNTAIDWRRSAPPRRSPAALHWPTPPDRSMLKPRRATATYSISRSTSNISRRNSIPTRLPVQVCRRTC